MKCPICGMAFPNGFTGGHMHYHVRREHIPEMSEGRNERADRWDLLPAEEMYAEIRRLWTIYQLTGEV